MGNMSKQRIELIAVIALAVVAAVIAYFRFVRKPASQPPSGIPGAVEASGHEIPELPDWLLGADSADFRQRPPYARPARDLFAPVEETSVHQPEPTPTPSSIDVPPVLTAVMRGAQGTLAVISDKVVGVGDKIGKYTVVEIGRQHAVLLSGDTRSLLQLGEPETRAAGPP